MSNNYISSSLDGTPARLAFPDTCEWCGLPIIIGRLAIFRSYHLDHVFHTFVQHLSCYEKTYQHCLKYGHTFTRFSMDPHPLIYRQFNMNHAKNYAQNTNNQC